MGEDGRLEWHGMWGNRSDSWMRSRPARSAGNSTQALRTGKSIVSRTADLVVAHPHSVRANEGCLVELATPLAYRGRTLGVLVVGWRSEVSVSDEQIHLSEALAGYVAAVLDNSLSRAESHRRRLEAEGLASSLETLTRELEERVQQRTDDLLVANRALGREKATLDAVMGGMSEGLVVTDETSAIAIGTSGSRSRMGQQVCATV